MPFVRIAAALILFLAALSPAAQAIEVDEDYVLVSPPQPTSSPGKIEVIEFFAYTCPHCYDLEPELQAWAKKLPGNVVLKREPVIFSQKWEPLARAYFALEALGAVNRLHTDVFDAIHVDGIDLANPDNFFDWGAQHGLDRAKLKAAYYSFSTLSKLSRAKELRRAYAIEGVPSLAVNGKYVTSASYAGSNESTLKVVSELIQKESKGGK